jgi:hypothetical protein
VRSEDVLRAASGRWPEILVAIGGMTREQLCTREGPCPHCSAGDPRSTRFRWDSDDGAGEWFCSHCGGKDGQGGGGNGLDLLSRLFGPTAERVAEWLGDSSPRSASSSPRSVRDSPRSAAPAAPAGEMEAFLWLEEAGQLEDQECFRGSLARARTYSTRWREFSQAGGTDQDAARAVELEMETIRGTDRLTPEQVVAGLREAARQQGPTTLDDARQILARALADGATRADLATLSAQLGRETELGGAAIAAVLRALEQEQVAVDAVAAEGERLAQAAGRRDGGDYLSLGQMFPAGLASSIARLTEFLPVDDPTSVLVFLATAAGTMKLGSEIIASRRLGWAAPLNLYAAMVGRSGIKKDPVYSLLMTRPLAPIAAGLAISGP